MYLYSPHPSVFQSTSSYYVTHTIHPHPYKKHTSIHRAWQINSTSPPWFLDGSRRNLARTICRGQRSVSRKQNFKIPIGCHGNLELQTLRPHLTMKDWIFAHKSLEKWNCIGPQIFWLSQNFNFLAVSVTTSKCWFWHVETWKLLYI